MYLRGAARQYARWTRRLTTACVPFALGLSRLCTRAWQCALSQRTTSAPTTRAGHPHAASRPFGARLLVAVVAAYIVTSYVGGPRGGPATAHAEADKGEFQFEVPPAPAQAKPLLTFDVHTGFSAPLNHHSLCPKDVGCVLKAGGGVGGSIERRWPSGAGVMGAYDLWFLDTDSVYELGVEQLLRGGLRYTMPTEVVFHPMFELTAGFLLYGDTFRVATAGAALQLLAGSEIELTEAVGLRVGFGLRVFSHSAFRTERDGVLRGKNGLFSESFYFEAGLTFL